MRIQYSKLLFILLASTFFALQNTLCLAKDYSKGILNPNSIYLAAKTITQKAYPNSDDVLADDYIIENYNPDGTAIIIIFNMLEN